MGPHSVRMAPGSTITTFTPKGFSSIRRASLKAVVQAADRGRFAGVGYHAERCTQPFTGVDTHLGTQGGVNTQVPVDLMGEPDAVEFFRTKAQELTRWQQTKIFSKNPPEYVLYW